MFQSAYEICSFFILNQDYYIFANTNSNLSSTLDIPLSQVSCCYHLLLIGFLFISTFFLIKFKINIKIDVYKLIHKYIILRKNNQQRF